ncbi:MAG TPA: tetratricopeptide repeat protein, partial [Pyrinomonadaceae bacterium]|nr:tetratricopeptide repeat protein [Pyrinomonadaceae bacterium]
MPVNKKFYRYALMTALFVCAPAFVSAQDLGSSNSLFNAPNPKTKSAPAKTTPKKTAAKKTAPAKTSVAAKKNVSKPKSKIAARTAGKTTKLNKSNAPKTAAENKTGGKPAAISKQPVAAGKQNSSSGTPKIETADNAAIKVEQAAKPAYDELFERTIVEGNAARDAREYVKAEGAYLRAQSMATKDSRAVYGLGNLYSDQQRWEEAERAYRAAIQLEPSSADAYIALSFVLTQPISNTNLADRYAEAEDAARRAIAIDPTSAVAFDQLGVALELRGIIDGETRLVYRKAIELEPNFALAYAHLGRLLRRKGLNNESSAAYRTAVQLSTDVPTMIMVADVMQSQQRYLDSEQLLRQALRQDPKNPTALNLLGRALTTRGSYEEAEKVLKKSADVSPNSFVSYSLLDSLFLRREKFDDSEKYLMKALKMVSPNEKKRLAQDFELVGDGFAIRGKNKDAARLYQQAVLL